MAKKDAFTEDDDQLLADLGVEVEAKKVAAYTPREERIIAGFEEIQKFVEEHGRLPEHGEERDIFERLYAVRLEQIRKQEDCVTLLKSIDKQGLLNENKFVSSVTDDLNDDELLEQLGVEVGDESSITTLKHVKSRKEIKAAEEIANRIRCEDFDKFKPLFDEVAEDVAKGLRQTRKIRKEAGFLKSNIRVGDFFILYGQTAYVAEIGDRIKGSDGSMDARTRVIYSNGTESNLLLDSLRRGLYKDESSRIISEPSAGPLFSGEYEDGDVETGTIYVLRSKSDHPWIKENRDLIHKIGVTGGDVKKRIGNPKVSSTYLMADVEVVATYELSNINPVKLEKLIHRFFEPARLNIEIKDRFGNPIDPREWFLVPLFVIDEAINRIKDGSIVKSAYDVKGQKISGS